MSINYVAYNKQYVSSHKQTIYIQLLLRADGEHRATHLYLSACCVYSLFLSQHSLTGPTTDRRWTHTETDAEVVSRAVSHLSNLSQRVSGSIACSYFDKGYSYTPTHISLYQPRWHDDICRWIYLWKGCTSGVLFDAVIIHQSWLLIFHSVNKSCPGWSLHLHAVRSSDSYITWSVRALSCP